VHVPPLSQGGGTPSGVGTPKGGLVYGTCTGRGVYHFSKAVHFMYMCMSIPKGGGRTPSRIFTEGLSIHSRAGGRALYEACTTFQNAYTSCTCTCCVCLCLCRLDMHTKCTAFEKWYTPRPVHVPYTKPPFGVPTPEGVPPPLLPNLEGG